MFPYAPVSVTVSQALSLIAAVALLIGGAMQLEKYSYKTRCLANLMRIFGPFALAGAELLIWFPPIVGWSVIACGFGLTAIDFIRDRLRF